mmetsp:Transcript_1783/g.3067  ORF Transcript_1783/g.3067 Transcript_1783/m.3067 type:complete len:102 (-) Transcript_1783:795-1100(-)
MSHESIPSPQKCWMTVSIFSLHTGHCKSKHMRRRTKKSRKQFVRTRAKMTFQICKLCTENDEMDICVIYPLGSLHLATDYSTMFKESSSCKNLCGRIGKTL